jgi:hypothetical protein
MFLKEIDFWVEQKLSWVLRVQVRNRIQVGFRQELSAGLITGVGEKIGERGELVRMYVDRGSYESFGLRVQGFGDRLK